MGLLYLFIMWLFARPSWWIAAEVITGRCASYLSVTSCQRTDWLNWTFTRKQVLEVIRAMGNTSCCQARLFATTCVPYQFDPSSSPSSSPSSGSDLGPLVDLSRGIFHSRLKTFLFSKSFPTAIYHFLNLH